MTHISASQINLYTRCQMKWHLEYNHNHRKPPSSSQQLGTLWHETLHHQHKNQTSLEDSINSIITPEYDAAATTDEYNQTEYNHAILNTLLPEYRERYPLKHEQHRELEFNHNLNGIRIKGMIDAVTSEAIADDKLYARRTYNPSKILSLATDPQIIIYLMIAEELELPTTLEYRVILKPTIGIRRHRQPETRSDYEMRLWDDIQQTPGAYFQTSRHTLDQRMKGYYQRMLSDAYDNMESIKNNGRVAMMNNQACQAYGGCHLLNICREGGE